MSNAAPIVQATVPSTVCTHVLSFSTSTLLTKAAWTSITTAVASSVVAVTAASSAAPHMTSDAQRFLNDFFQDNTVAPHSKTARRANRAVKDARSGIARFEAVCHRAAPKLPKSFRILHS